MRGQQGPYMSHRVGTLAAVTRVGQFMEGQPRILSWEEGGFQAGKGEVEEKNRYRKLGKRQIELEERRKQEEGSRVRERKKLKKEGRHRQGDTNRGGNVTTQEMGQRKRKGKGEGREEGQKGGEQ